ncbi:glucuronate isomerase [Krasilnikovia cinnamomea]|uniref:Uronate isomerase n=1 Tax=Krasilnikovia cinnamomea TaxID=349313 RepID=A0A4Q7ZRH8_9ACTN|nr:glucuronate isomerase [Krasilnikovia cinnamomea]RZU53411.1 glucuronate isomerase [Krasilnikovia cinnamomea]
MRRLHLDEDRAFPAETMARDAARRIYAATRHLPLVCPHTHVDAGLLADDLPFPDPARLFVTPDHYVTRMIHSAGVRLEELGIDGLGDQGNARAEADARRIWRTFCEHWHLFRGTPSRFWLTHQLVEVFGVATVPSAESADALFDELVDRLRKPAFSPRALFERFGIHQLATTDSPLSSLSGHARLRAAGWGGRVVPTFRPDSLLHVAHPHWIAETDELAALTGMDTGDYAGFVSALAHRRHVFRAAGALATDHGHASADTTSLSPAEAARIYTAARAGRATPAQAAAFAGHMLFEMARMSCEDGLVMQLHPGVLRNHHRGILRQYGHDRGFDIPTRIEFTRALRPLLEAFGHTPSFRMIVFTVDETTYSRELAPLAGAYPALTLGAPWWFLDSPQGLRRYREAVTETAGFYNTAGFVDDTRAFTSIPARHDLARRIDAGYLATLVSEHHLDLEEAMDTAIDLAYRLPLTHYGRRPANAPALVDSTPVSTASRVTGKR